METVITHIGRHGTRRMKMALQHALQFERVAMNPSKHSLKRDFTEDLKNIGSAANGQTHESAKKKTYIGRGTSFSNGWRKR